MMGAEDEAARSGWMGKRGVFSLVLWLGFHVGKQGV